MPNLPTAEDGPAMAYFRFHKRLPTLRRRNLRRQVPAPIEVDSEDSSDESDGESSDSESSAGAPSPASPASPTTTGGSSISFPPPQATISSVALPQVSIDQPALIGTTFTTVPRVTESTALSRETPQTSAPGTRPVSSQTQASTSTRAFISSQPQSTTNPPVAALPPSTTRASTSSITFGQTGTTRSTNNALPTLPVPEAVQSEALLPTGKTRAHTTLSHGATIALEVIGAITGILILVGIALFILRRLKRRRLQQRGENLPDEPPSPTVISSHQSSSRQGSLSRMKRYLTVPTLIHQKVTRARDLGGLRSPTVESAIVRKERLGLVKEELLNEKEDNLRGEFLRSPRAPVDKQFDEKRVSDDEESLILKMELGVRQGLEAPSKAILKRNTSGKMVLRGVAKDKEVGVGPESSEDDLVKDAAKKGSDKRLKPPSANTKFKMAGFNDPTMMSGGLRMSGRGIGNEGLIAAPPQIAGGGKIDVAAWKNLEGLRKGDPLIERGMDRQSFVSGWQGSTTSWGTNVWERLERERELREGRERMEGGLGGEAAAANNNRASSVAKYRDPLSWVKDQAERRDGQGRG